MIISTLSKIQDSAYGEDDDMRFITRPQIEYFLDGWQLEWKFVEDYLLKCFWTFEDIWCMMLVCGRIKVCICKNMVSQWYWVRHTPPPPPSPKLFFHHQYLHFVPTIPKIIFIKIIYTYIFYNSSWGYRFKSLTMISMS